MNFRKLITYLTMGTAAAMPLAVAQNPTILQGSYISNVFGNSNFIKNPNAQTNIADVTVSNATVTRSTTTPLVATSEFNITTSTSTGYADWSTRTFDAGMKNQNCEARFTYRGFSVGSTTAQIIQGASTVVAQLTLTPSTDPRIASINFPCGDLSAVTKFRLQQATASLTGTNEIGAIYVGLATNMANVAQAEEYGGIEYGGGTVNAWGITQTTYAADFSASGSNGTAFGKCSAPATAVPQLVCNNMPSGNYQIVWPMFIENNTSNTLTFCRVIEASSGTVLQEISQGSFNTGTQAYTGRSIVLVGNASFSAAGSRTFKFQCKATSGQIDLRRFSEQSNAKVIVYRFPSSSELVVTPERQNVFGGVKFTGGSSTLFNAVAPSTTFANYTDATNWKPTSAGGTGTYYGKATSTTTTGELGLKIPNMPAGTYRMTVRGNVFPDASAGASGQYTACTIELYETTTAAGFAKNYQFTGHGAAATIPGPGDFSGQLLMDGIFANTSVADRNFIVRAQKLYDSTAGNVGKCLSTTFNSDIVITIQPLDQPSNSALYVQGPVLGAQTGAAIPASYVGETKQARASGCGTSATFSDGASITITPGIWRVTANGNMESTGTITEWLVFVGPQSGNVTTWRQSFYNDGWFSGITSGKLPTITPPIYVRYDGTNLYRFEDNTWKDAYASATGTLYAKFYRTATCVNLYTSIVAERVN